MEIGSRTSFSCERTGSASISTRMGRHPGGPFSFDGNLRKWPTTEIRGTLKSPPNFSPVRICSRTFLIRPGSSTQIINCVFPFADPVRFRPLANPSECLLSPKSGRTARMTDIPPSSRAEIFSLTAADRRPLKDLRNHLRPARVPTRSSSGAPGRRPC